MRIITTLIELDNKLEIGAHFVEEKEMELIQETLKLNEIKNEEELRNIRDIVVLYYSKEKW